MSTSAWPGHCERAALRGQLEYRVDFIVEHVHGHRLPGQRFRLIYVVLHSFHTIAGWTSVTWPSSTHCACSRMHCWHCRSTRSIPDITIREGKFDRYLVRPMNPLLQLMTNRFQINAVGDVLTATALFVYAASIAHVDFSPLHIVYLILAVIGGALAEAGSSSRCRH